MNVANSAVAPAIYFYDQDGNMIDADMVVDAMMDGVEVGRRRSPDGHGRDPAHGRNDDLHQWHGRRAWSAR